MTPQEAQMLQDLVRKVEGTQLTEKDPDAEALLQDGLARDPDALYKLAQTVLIQNMALDQARAQMQRMQQQLAPPAPQPAKATSFLGGLFHRDPQPAPPAQPPYTPVYTGQPPQYQQQPYAPPYPGQPAYQAPPPAYYPPPAGSSGGGFLRSAATTAAGVAGGMLAFEGIESLMHGGMHEGFGGWGGGMAGGPMEETVINNYYDDPSQAGGEHREFSGPDEHSHEANQSGQDQGSAQDYLADSGANDVPQDQGYQNQGYQDQGDAQDYASDAGADPGQDYASDAGDSGGQDFVDDSGGGDSGGF
jgi:uncharacterized protein